MNARALARLKQDLSSFLGEILQDVKLSQQRHWGQVYVRGLLLDGQRKSIEPLAARLKLIDSDSRDVEQALQQFINQSPWVAESVRGRLQTWIAEWKSRHLPLTQPFLILDDTGFPKQGKHSVGVTRQYTGTLGKVASCQVAVTLHYAVAETTFCADAQLYLPEEWTSDRPRLQQAAVPEEIGHRSKWQIALEMLAGTKAHGLQGIVLADSLFGSVTPFREALDAGGWKYCVGIDSTLVVVAGDADLGAVPAWTGVGRPPVRPAGVSGATKVLRTSVKRWAIERSKDFRVVMWREGSKGKMANRFAAWRVRPAHKMASGRTPLSSCWLLVEWPEDAQGPTRFFFSNLPESIQLRELVRTAKARWQIEMSYRELKDELGFDHFEGRSWRGWHHHVTLVMLAYAFLMSQRRALKKKASAQKTR